MEEERRKEFDKVQGWIWERETEEAKAMGEREKVVRGKEEFWREQEERKARAMMKAMGELENWRKWDAGEPGPKPTVYARGRGCPLYTDRSPSPDR